MKRTSYLVFISTMVTIISISSCKKDQLVPPGPTSSGNNVSTSNTINLVANHWIKDANGFYVSTFNNIISHGSSVKVYLLTEGFENQINHFIFFMGGELWATTTTTDVRIIYRSSGRRPFDFLNIKLVVE